MQAARWRVCGAAVLALSWAMAPAARAATVPSSTQIELDVAVPTGADLRPGPPAREQVVAKGLDEAVREVASRYVNDPAELDPLERIGAKARDFVLRYRVIERIGERDTVILRTERRPPAREYAARIRVDVDTPRLTNALAAAGLWQPDTTDAASGSYWIEAPLEWSAWVAFRRALLMAGAAGVVPREITEEGMLVAVDGGRGNPASILSRVASNPPEGLEVRIVGRGEPPRIAIRGTAPDDAARLGSD